MNKQIVLTLFCLTLFVAVDAQTVHLSRLQRAAGLGYVPYTDGTGKAAYTLLSSLIPAGITGSGTTNTLPIWTSSSTLGDSRITQSGSSIFFAPAGTIVWAMTGDQLGKSGSTVGTPRLYSVSNQSWFTFTSDLNTGVKWDTVDVFGLHAGDATNPMIEIDGTGDLLKFDPDDDGTADVIISPTTTSTELLDIGAFGTTSTKLAGINASGVVTEVTLSGLSFAGDVLTATDGSTTNEIQDLTIGGSGPTYTVDISSGSDVTIAAAGIATLSEGTPNILTITATEVDGSTTNEIQSISVTGTTTATIDLSDDATDASITGAGISTVSVAGNAITVTSTEIDGSVSNELQDLTIGGSGPTYTVDIASGADVTIAAAGINTLSEGTANVLTITGTEVDGSTTNEIQQITPSDNGTNFWWALGSSTDSIVLVEGTGITMSRSGDNVTINGAGGSFGQLSYNGEFEITNTSSDTLDPDFSWDEIEVGLISTDDATHSITTNYAGYAEFMFNVVLFNESGGTFTGAVNFELYKNGSYLSPFFGYTERLENNESKIVTLTGMLSVASGDDFHIRAYLSSAGTIDISRPVFNIKKI